MILLYIKVFI